MALDQESLKRQIPFYLTGPDQQELIKNLEAITAKKAVSYFTNLEYLKSEILQGDGWRGFELFIFETGKRTEVRGIVLSNSCDISPENERQTPSKIVFAPLVKLSKFRKLLESSKINEERIQAKIDAIKAQKTSNIFFIPASGVVNEDYVIRLDDLHSMPAQSLLVSKSKEKLFTLNQTGFYVFVLKLSVHFCRLQENITRTSPT